MMRTNKLLGKCNTVSGNDSWSCWSVNFPKPNKEQNRAANVSLNSDTNQDIPRNGC